MVQRREAGLLVGANTPDGFAEGVCRLWSAPPARAAVRAYAEGFSWDATSEGQMAVFAKARERLARALAAA